MSTEERLDTFEQFWPTYVRAHASKANRMLHFAGTTAAMVCVGGAIVLRRPALLLLAPVLGYGPAWIGHFFVEGNKPASFEHPLWSFRADLVMWKKTIEGTMDEEVERVLRGDTEPQAASENASQAPNTSTPAEQTNGARVETVN